VPCARPPTGGGDLWSECVWGADVRLADPLFVWCRKVYALCVDRCLISTQGGGTRAHRLPDPLRFSGSAVMYPGGSVYSPFQAEVTASKRSSKRYVARMETLGLAIPPHIKEPDSIAISQLATNAPPPNVCVEDQEEPALIPSRSRRPKRERSEEPKRLVSSTEAVTDDPELLTCRESPEKVVEIALSMLNAAQTGRSPSSGRASATAAARHLLKRLLSKHRSKAFSAWNDDKETRDRILRHCTGTFVPLTRGMAPPPRLAPLYSRPLVTETGQGSQVAGLVVTPHEGLVGFSLVGPAFASAAQIARAVFLALSRGDPLDYSAILQVVAPATVLQKIHSPYLNVRPIPLPRDIRAKPTDKEQDADAAVRDLFLVLPVGSVWSTPPGPSLAVHGSLQASLCPSTSDHRTRPSSGALRCILCDQCESKAQSRLRAVSVHPIVPVKASGEPVLICDQCEAKVLDTREWAASQKFLHGEDGMEELCALCGAGTPELPTSLTMCSARVCVRGYCEACTDVLLDTPRAKRVLSRQTEWICPPCAAVSALEVHALELLEQVAAADMAFRTSLSEASRSTLASTQLLQSVGIRSTSIGQSPRENPCFTPKRPRVRSPPQPQRVLPPKADLQQVFMQVDSELAVVQTAATKAMADLETAASSEAGEIQQLKTQAATALASRHVLRAFTQHEQVLALLQQKTDSGEQAVRAAILFLIQQSLQSTALAHTTASATETAAESGNEAGPAARAGDETEQSQQRSDAESAPVVDDDASIVSSDE
jgi:hypothetical protein